MQLEHLRVHPVEQPRRPRDLPRTRQEAQDVALVPLQREPDRRRHVTQQGRIHPGAVRGPDPGRRRGELHRVPVALALAPHDRRGPAAVQDREQLRPGPGVARRGGRDQLQLRPQRRPYVHQEGHRRVGVEMPLVALVEQHHVHARQLRIALEALQQDARRHHLDPGRGAGPSLAAHREADRAADLLAEQPGHPPGRRPHRHPPRLGHQHPADRSVPYEPRQRQRDQRRLAGAGRSGQHRRAALRERGEQLGDGMADGETVDCVVSDHALSLVRAKKREGPVIHRALHK